MKYLKQFGIIIIVSFLGEILKAVIPLQVPASIYGLIIMFLGLSFKIIPLKAVKDAGDFLVEIMPVMFVPAGVGLMASWGILKPVLIKISIITIVSTVLVMVISGWATQLVLRTKKEGKEK